MSDAQLVCVVDDDESVRLSLRALLEASAYTVNDFDSALRFLASDALGRCDCLVVDVRMPEMNGLALQEELNRRGRVFPVIVITGHGDVPLAVRAMKAGALDFIEKPFDGEVMLASVGRALEVSRATRDEAAEARAAKDLLDLLTPRERNVLEQLVAGRSNKVAAYELGISPRTVEIHRARIMDKFNVRSLSEVVRIALTATRFG
ncbi:MAG TPA: response regulator [Rhizomicrobium sp.]|nr:response regulator [Rhizomicrobium sp.]